MDASSSPRSAPAQPYRLPELLRDIRLLDLLELSGTTVQAGRWMRLSQPTISRRYRSLANDFGLTRDRRVRCGCAYGTSGCIRMLRLGCRAHRLAAGVVRLGSDSLHSPLLAGCSSLLPAPQRFRATAHWLELVRQGVLDGALISGLELPRVEEADLRDLEVVAVGELALALALCAPPSSPEREPPAVLLPSEAVAPGLWQALKKRGLTLRDGGNHPQSLEEWIQRIQRTALALLVADGTAEGRPSLRRWPLPTPLRAPVWLALPADWQDQAVLRQTLAQIAHGLHEE